MRSGKTLSSIVNIKDYIKQTKSKNLIYSNIKLYFKNVKIIYTPYLILPISKLKDCLILIDDISSYSNLLNNFNQILVNLSGKNNIHIIITCQYYTHVPTSIRLLSNQKIYCKYDKNTDILYNYHDNNDFIDYRNIFSMYDKNELYYIEKAVETYGNCYDTTEIVSRLNENLLISEITKICKNKTDIENNINIFFKNKKKIETLINELC